MKRCWAILWIFAFAGCGNPFSGTGNHDVSYHSPNLNCQQLPLDKSSFSVGEFRDLVHCLNSDTRLNELESFLNDIPDNQLSAVSDFLNVLLNQDLKTLFAIRESYGRLKSSGLLTPVLDQMLDLGPLSPVAPASEVISDFLFDRSIHSDIDHLRQTLAAASARRLLAQHRGDSTLDRTIGLVDTFLKSNAEFNFKKIQQILSRSAGTLPSDPQSLGAIASFLETIFAEKNFGGFSALLEKAAKAPIQCFDQSFTVVDPISIGVKQVLTESPRDAKLIFEAQARSLVMAGRGYCSIPYSAEPLFKFTDSLIQHPGFDSSYSYLLPLLRTPHFIRLISSPQSRDFALGASFLTDSHAFQDIIALVALNQSISLTDQPARAADYLDRLFASLSAEQAVRLANVLSPFFKTLDKTPILDAYESLPSFDIQMDEGLRNRLHNLFVVGMRSPKIDSLVPMFKRLIKEDRLIPIWDQIFTLFERRVEAGKHPLVFKTMKKLDSRAASLQKLLLPKTDFHPKPSRCAGVDTDLAFIDKNLRGTATWFALDRCFSDSAGDRMTLKAGKELSDFAASRGKLGAITDLESDVIQGAFKIDRNATLDLLSGFVNIRDHDSDSVKAALHAASSFVQLVEPAVSKSPALRKIVADGVEDETFYKGLIEIHRNSPKPIPNVPRTLTSRSSVTIWVSPEEVKKASILDGVHALMKEYCPSLNTQDKDCDIEDDQVLLYRAAPEKLAAKVVDESLNRSNSWLHPAMAPTWTHSGTEQVRDFEYHYNPLLHELRANAGLAQSVFDFFGGYRDKVKDLQAFIGVHGRKYSLIPYVHHQPGYPRDGKREYISRIRIKLVSDLDRLELVAINVDFKPFGFVQNIGMKFIRQIALSWGDEPTDKRPGGVTDETLAQTTEDIKQMIRQIDRQALKKLGECDPRGKSRFGRWLQQTICKGEIGDFSARIFNLKILTPLFDQMQVREAGGNDGMRVLRDLFYSLHSTNSQYQLGRFGQGADMPATCLKEPAKGPIAEECSFDQLTLISRVTRLGLLHQAGLSAAFTPGSSVNETLRTLTEVSSNGALKNQIATWLMRPQSTQTLVSIKNWVSRLPESASSQSLHLALRTVSMLQPHTWISGVVSAIEAEPNLIDKLSSPLLLWTETSPVEGLETPLLTRAPQFRKWANARIAQIDDRANAEIKNLILLVANQPEQLEAFIRQTRDIPEFNQPTIKADLNRWLESFAAPPAKPVRTALKNYVLSPEFEKFCDVFSDSQLVDKTYNFLEKIHQNPDSDKFFTTCRAFLFR